MKIASTDYLDQIKNASQKRANGTDLHEDKGFSRLLEENKNTEAASSQTAGGSAAAGLLQNASMVGMIMAGQGVDNSSPLKQVESALDKIEQYADALGDSTKTLKDIEPLANELNKAAGQLSQLSQRLPEGDPMKSLSSDTAVLATVEAMKFKRGDYI
ncbi:hypothetical protein LJB86_00025 [Deltaproteobacteria bacterium OttesenSCG-928-M10]|nr:hypothetical protein [Deltaproteobacteria bacterium OttesenSCG-928-M10]